MSRDRMKLILWWLFAAAWWPAAGLGTKALGRVLWNEQGPLWHGAALGLWLGCGTLLTLTAYRKGWIPGIVDEKRSGLKERARDLAAERERILAEARAKARGEH